MQCPLEGFHRQRFRAVDDRDPRKSAHIGLSFLTRSHESDRLPGHQDSMQIQTWAEQQDACLEQNLWYIRSMKKHAYTARKPQRPGTLLASTFVILGLALVLTACTTKPEPVQDAEGGVWSGTSTVKVTSGLLQGKRDGEGTLAWLGIPYAAAPVGNLRWKAPQEAEAWKGIRDATRFGPRAIQAMPLTGWTTGSEDCLYLNVWRPMTKETGLPVYVWIHGGGNSSGSSDQVSSYYGQAFASRANAVFISVNYRLGIFGWFAHPALRSQAQEGDSTQSTDPDSDSGNFGTLDLIQALRWIEANAASFGGDARSVTVAGESAGAFNILSLLVAPKAQGLFHRAVIESGYTSTSTPAKASDFATKLGLRLLMHRKIASSEVEAAAFAAVKGSSWMAEFLRAATAKELQKLIPAGTSGMSPFPYPIFDGTVLPADGFAALRRAPADPSRSANVPLIIGTNLEETKIFQWLGRQDWKDPLYQAQARVAASRWKADGADSLADLYQAGDPARKVYLYRFDWGAPDATGTSVLGGSAGARLGAFHSLEIPFFLQTDTVLGNILPFRLFTKANETGRKALQSAIGAALASFIRTGDPDKLASSYAPRFPGWKAGLPAWDPWDAASENPPFMVLDAGLDSLRTRIEHGRVTTATVESLVETGYEEPLRTRLRRALEGE